MSFFDNKPGLLSLFKSWPPQGQKEFLNCCTGIKGVKITYDAFFKEVFNPEYSKWPLSSMLSTFLGFPVTIVSVLPNDSTRISDETSLLITDIVVQLENGSLANIEIQKIGYSFPGERCACYGADLLLRQYRRIRDKKGDTFSYQDIKDVYLLVIFEQSPKEFQKFPNTFIHHSQTFFPEGLQLNLLQKYIFIPLDIYKKRCKINMSVQYRMLGWLFYVMTNPTKSLN